jgi:hypothetical protein
MTELAKIFLEILKLAPRYLLAIAIIAALFLFMPAALMKSFGIFDFAQQYRAWIAVAFIATTVLFGVDRAVVAIDRKRQKKASEEQELRAAIEERQKALEKEKLLQKRLERLHQLTEDEKQILRFYFLKRTKTNILRIDDGVVQGLVKAGIIYRSADVGNMLEGFAHNITDFAWNYVNEHLDLLVGTTNIARCDKRFNDDW